MKYIVFREEDVPQELREAAPPAINSAAIAFQHVADLQTAEREHFVILCLNSQNQIIERVDLYKGTLNTAVVRIADVFHEAIRANAAAIILAHNHPSGECSPSQQDIDLTKQVSTTGKTLDILVLDHLIVGKGAFYSMRESGVITP